MAFIPGPALPSASVSTPARHRSICRASTTPSTPSVSRRHLLAGLAGVLATLAVPNDASAKNGEGLERAFSKVLFPKEGFNAPDTLQPSGNIVDRDILSKPAGKAALSKLREFDTAVTDLYSKFQADPQVELSPTVRKVISISELRSALNTVNEAVDEQSQIETDKVVRGIIQDIGELQNAAALKTGVPRTLKKIERTNDWFIKLTGDFKRLLSFYA